MFWRIISALAVLFWAVMTGLLIRDTYFPEESRFAEVPPAFVFDLFLNHRETATTLQLRKDDDRIGHATVTIRKQNVVGGGRSSYDLMGSGQIEGRAFGAKEKDLTWRLSGDLDEGHEVRGVVFQTAWRGEGDPNNRKSDAVTATASWRLGGKPDIEVRQGGKVVLDTASAYSLLGASTLPLGGMMRSLPGTTPQPGFAVVTAREGAMMLAGKRRKCYLVQMQFMGLYNVKIVFTEAGELARIDLPQGFHLLEPTIHGLDAGLTP